MRARTKNCGGSEGDRTLDLCVANAALSQLSYEPASEWTSLHYALTGSGIRSVTSFLLFDADPLRWARHRVRMGITYFVPATLSLIGFLL